MSSGSGSIGGTVVAMGGGALVVLLDPFVSNWILLSTRMRHNDETHARALYFPPKFVANAKTDETLTNATMIGYAPVVELLTGWRRR